MPELNPSLASQQLNIMFRIGALVHGRDDITHLEFGEPDFATPQHIVDAAQRSIANERQTYGPGPGLPWLRTAVAERAARVTRLVATPEQVTITMGGTGGLMASLLALCSPGDEVLTPDPAWPGYDAMLAAASATRVTYPLLATDGWQPDSEALEAAITPRTKALVINSPANPTGAVFTRAVIERLVAIAQRYQLWILSDECYDELVYAGEHVSPASLDATRTITIGTCSKAYSMTGWRVGWAVAPPSVAPIVALAATAHVNNLPTLIQRAAHAALTGPQECVRLMAQAYEQRRDLVVELLRRHDLLEYIPAGAFYALINIARAAHRGSAQPSDGAFDSVAFAERLIQQRRVAVGPGAAFGSRTAQYVRVSLASSPDALQTGIAAALDAAQASAVP